MNMKIAPVFTDGVVLQKNKPLYVFGTGIGNVKIHFLGKEFEASSFDDKWEVCLGKYPSGGPYSMDITLIDNNGEETKTISDIYVGTVILIAGQSNVQWTVADAQQFGLTYDIDENPLVRTFVTSRLEEHPHIDARDGWLSLKKDNCHHWSALGLHLAEKLQSYRNEAVGFVGCWQGASKIQTWLPRDLCMRADIYVEEVSHHKKTLDLYYDWNKPGLCYEYQFKTICPFAFDSAIWYQGCSSTSDGTEKKYGKLLIELISRWRYDLRQNLEFTVIELANLDNSCETWKDVQAQQIDIPNRLDGVKTVVCKDISESNTIHPVDKRPLADRIFNQIYKK